MHYGRGRGVDSMAAVLLVGGIGFLSAGLLAIGFGIPVKEFSFGNTLIVTGAIVACTGAMMLSLWIVVLELKNIVRQFGFGISRQSHRESMLSSASVSVALPVQGSEEYSSMFSGEQSALDNAPQAEPSPSPWREETASLDPGQEELVALAPKPRRNLLFSSTSRKERERAQARAAGSFTDPGPIAPGPVHPVEPQPAESGEKPSSTFDDAWPKSERIKVTGAPLPRRTGRAPSTFTEAEPDTRVSAARREGLPSVTVLKSGIVDGMAYSLYSDGSIEAQMPEGTMRFASIDALRSYLDQRS